MKLNDTSAAIAAQERLAWPPESVLRIQSMIPAALSNLAKAVSRDPKRKNLLMTDPDVVQVTVTPGVEADIITGSVSGSSDLSSIVDTYGVMLDALQYGTIYHQYQVPFSSGDVTTGVFPSGYIEIQGVGFILTNGLPVYLETTGTLPNGVLADTTYYIVAEQPEFNLAVSKANAETQTSLNLASIGSGNSAIFSHDQILQWLSSPTQGSLTTCLPFSMLQGWLVGYKLNVKGIPFQGAFSKLKFEVPFQPRTLEDLPDSNDLQQDFLDTLIGVAATSGIEDVPPTDKSA